MVKMSSEQGVKVIVATPHRKDVNQFHSIEEVQEILANVRELSLREGCQTEIML
jgi:tyrosine-protein phosphatase YwqE